MQNTCQDRFWSPLLSRDSRCLVFQITWQREASAEAHAELLAGLLPCLWFQHLSDRNLASALQWEKNERQKHSHLEVDKNRTVFPKTL